MTRLSKGRTCITIAHRLSTIRNADMVVVLGGGKVLEMGKFNDLYYDTGSAFRAFVDKQTFSAVEGSGSSSSASTGASTG